jgi:CheY-like chemotaxis protein
MSLDGKRILLVEDEFLIVQDLARAFTEAGAAVMTASGIAGALELIVANQKLDGAVLDINLQGEMAWPVADALAQRGVPFVFATGYEADIIPERFAASRRWAKPVNSALVAEALFPK